MAWVRARLCKLQKGCTRLAAASDKDYQLLAHDWWFSPGAPASSTTKTGRHDYIAESGIKTPKIKSINHHTCIVYMYINGDKCLCHKGLNHWNFH